MKTIQMIKDEYERIAAVFAENSNSFKRRREQVESILFTEVNWSDSYLEVAPYLSIINQSKPPKIFGKEEPSSIKNHFLNDQLVYSFRLENENWGSVFVDYEKDLVKWFLFSENFDDEMVLLQLVMVYRHQDLVTKVVSYRVDEDEEIESLFIDKYKYDDEDRIGSIDRNGFYEMKTMILPERVMSFVYKNDRVCIYSTQKTVNDSQQLIYEGAALD